MSRQLDPLYGTVVRLLAFDLLSIQQHPHIPGLFQRKGRPVKRVEQVGVVVSVESRKTHIVFTLDDGTGCIPCIFWINQLANPYYSHLEDYERGVQAAIAEAQAKAVQLGYLLRVQGQVSCYHDKLQIKVSNIVKENDSNSEVLHWMQACQLAVRCYDLPWAPPPT